MHDIVIRGGTIVDGTGAPAFQGDVALDGDTAIDADGLVITPGFVDLQVHFREPGGEEAETIQTGSRGAALGGFTAVVVMPNTTPTIDSAAVVHQIHDLSIDALCEVVPSAAITVDRDGEALSPMAELVRSGVRVFTDDGGEREEQVIYLPVSTAQGSFGGLDHVQRVMFTVGPPDIDAASLDDADRAVASIRSSIAAHHGFHPDDRTALRVRDRIHSYADVQAVFTWLQRFTWVVGIGTVLAAMVGVGNTLLISVKERTRELGLRKALGARRADIIGMVLREAFLLTATAGWAGLLAGIALVEGARRWMPENDYLRDPNVDLESVGWSVLALVATGVVAGLVPAWQAAMVPPVVALQDE